MKPRNPTPSGNPAKPTAAAGSDDVSKPELSPDSPVERPEEVNGDAQHTQMELPESSRPSGPIRLRPPTRPGGLAGRLGGGDGDGSSKQHQRTIDELNRRIIALEGTQRERAQELAKEKEVRLKAERQLAAAERALQESAALIESTRVEAKRELDTEIRKRDSETGRQSKDQQKAVTDLQEELRRLQEELTEARAQGGQQRQSDSPGGAEAWEARAIAQFEEDIENYRTRIKSLIQERDSLSREKERLAEALASGGGGAAAAEEDGVVKEELIELRERNTQLEQQLEALRQEAAQGIAASSGTAPADGDSVKLTAELERIANERDLAQSEAEKLMAELDGLRELRRQDQEKFDRERAANQFNKESGAVSLRKTIDVQQKAIAAITRERDEISRSHESLTAELKDTVTAREDLLKEVETLRGETDAIRGEAAKTASEFQQQHEAALARLRQEQEQALAAAAQRQADVEADRADLLQQLSAASGRIADLESRLGDAERELRNTGDALAKQEQSLSDIAHDSERSIRELQEKHAQEIAVLRAEKDQLDREAREYIARLREEHAAEVAALSRSEGEIIAGKSREIGDLRAQLEALQQRAARELADTERAAEQALNNSRIQMDQQLAERDRQMTEILNALAEAREGRQADNASFSGEFRALMKQRDDAVADVLRMRAQVERQAEEILEFKNDATKNSDELRARAEREILRLQREREQLIKQRDEFRNRVKQLADQQRRLMEEIANDPFRSLGSHRLPEPAPVFIEPISTTHNASSNDLDHANKPESNEDDSFGETILERPESAQKAAASKPNIPLPKARPAAPPPPQVRRAD